MAVWTQEGTVRGYTSQLADFTHSLQSVRALLKSRHAVIFDEDGRFVFNKITGELNHITDDGVNYKMRQWIIPPEQVEAALQASQELRSSSGGEHQGGFGRQEP